jgi:DNA-binding LacI/PurR family transcriptional regulator
VPASRRPTAVVAQADLLAAGVVRAAGALGLRVSQDVTVTGFDGVDLPWLDHVLTTVEQPGADKGRAMGRLVRLALEGRQITDEPFPVRLRVGTTSSSPPSMSG